MLLVWWVVSYQHRELQSTQGLVMVHAPGGDFVWLVFFCRILLLSHVMSSTLLPGVACWVPWPNATLQNILVVWEKL